MWCLAIYAGGIRTASDDKLKIKKRVLMHRNEENWRLGSGRIPGFGKYCLVDAGRYNTYYKGD